jgi:uncharacterized protein
MFSNRLTRYFIFLILLLPFYPIYSQEIEELVEVDSYVIDKADILNDAQEQQLEQKLRELEEEKGSQLVVVLVETTGLEPIEDYTIRLAEEIKAGREGVDDGVILLAAMQDRRIRIEVGYGLEGAITDAQSALIIANTITPRFKNGDFVGGINAGVDDLIHLIRGEPLPEATRNPSGSDDSGFQFLLPVIILLFIIFPPLLTKLFGKVMGGLVGTGAAFLLGWLLISLGIGFMAAIFYGIFSLFSSLGGGRGGRGGGGYRGGFGGGLGGGFGGGFGGGSSGGGFGGFSGGGGGFGGGGASGSW